MTYYLLRTDDDEEVFEDLQSAIAAASLHIDCSDLPPEILDAGGGPVFEQSELVEEIIAFRAEQAKLRRRTVPRRPTPGQ